MAIELGVVRRREDDLRLAVGRGSSAVRRRPVVYAGRLGGSSGNLCIRRTIERKDKESHGATA